MHKFYKDMHLKPTERAHEIIKARSKDKFIGDAANGLDVSIGKRLSETKDVYVCTSL